MFSVAARVIGSLTFHWRAPNRRVFRSTLAAGMFTNETGGPLALQYLYLSALVELLTGSRQIARLVVRFVWVYNWIFKVIVARRLCELKVVLVHKVVSRIRWFIYRSFWYACENFERSAGI